MLDQGTEGACTGFALACVVNYLQFSRALAQHLQQRKRTAFRPNAALRASPREHMDRVMAQGDFRPMGSNPRAMDELLSILQSREQLYAKADVTLDTSGKSAKQALPELIKLTV